MGGYTNGRFPLSMLVHLGGLVYLPAGTAARWKWMVAQALAKYSITLYITPGWNGYRPFDIQVEYRADLGKWAAVPGTSSHGLIYRGKVVAAADVANWRDLAPGNEALAWSRFKALCRLAGFTVDFVTPQELWHIGDFNDVWTPPTWAGGGNAHRTESIPLKEDTMRAVRWSGHVLTLGEEKCSYQSDYVDAVNSAIIHNPTGQWMELDDAGLTTALETFGIPWAAVDACMRGWAYDITGAVGGHYWSRGIEQKIDTANLAMSLAGLRATADVTKPIEVPRQDARS